MANNVAISSSLPLPPREGRGEGMPPSNAASFSGSVDLGCDLLVLGAGPGGYSAVSRAADLGLKVILVERLCPAWRCMPERRLHPQQGAAARGRRDKR